ncbi:hypothetical protein V7759_07000 [Bacillus sp. H7(2023)]|uniref:hypothetical protein n=1 Tax=Bacillus TaxID=1386 RepID=UPI0009377521
MSGNGFYNVKLTDKEVYEMLYLNKVKGLQPCEIETMFPVARTTIRNIVNGRSRKDCYHAFMDYAEKHPEKVNNLFS